MLSSRGVSEPVWEGGSGEGSEPPCSGSPARPSNSRGEGGVSNEAWKGQSAAPTCSVKPKSMGSGVLCPWPRPARLSGAGLSRESSKPCSASLCSKEMGSETKFPASRRNPFLKLRV